MARVAETLLHIRRVEIELDCAWDFWDLQGRHGSVKEEVFFDGDDEGKDGDGVPRQCCLRLRIRFSSFVRDASTRSSF